MYLMINIGFLIRFIKDVSMRRKKFGAVFNKLNKWLIDTRGQSDPVIQLNRKVEKTHTMLHVHHYVYTIQYLGWIGNLGNNQNLKSCTDVCLL